MQQRTGRAAIITEPEKPVVVEDILIDPPGKDEVLVRMVASGVCHTDLHIKKRNGGGMNYPILLGHEGGGIVEAVGEGVTHLQPGDPVVIAYRAPCGQCPACLRGDLRRCWAALRAGPRLHRASDGATLAPVLRCGTFSTHTVVHSKAAIKMPDEMPLDKACLLACGVVTGVGAVFNTANVWRGATVAVFGCGGVGISVIQGARLTHASRIIAIDISPAKLEWAKRFGATDVVDARDGDAAQQIRDLTGGNGVDYAFEAVGMPQTLEQAIRSLTYAGTATLIGVPDDSAELTVSLGNIDTGVFWNKATITVSHCGDTLPSADFPLLADMYLKGKLDLDNMITREITLNDVNEAFDAMEKGDVLRSVIRF